jgi:alpha-tubulin suppressor-like RCC1 family protein
LIIQQHRIRKLLKPHSRSEVAMKKFAAGLSLLLSTAAVYGCADLTNVISPSPAGPAFSIVDAASGHGEGFHWLPPLAKHNSAAGDFDPDANPVVVICVLDDDGCGDEIAEFSAAGEGSERVRVEGSEHYIVNWHTGAYNIQAGQKLRIAVHVGDDILVGYADLQVVGNAKDLKMVRSSEFIGIVAGQTLPVRFRIETGIAAAIVVDPPAPSIEVGANQTLTAKVRDLHGNPMEIPVTWSSSDPAIASVDPSGVVTAMSAGDATVKASAGNIHGTASVHVSAPPPPPPPPAPDMVISAGTSHTCAVDNEGGAFCWGMGNFGRLGNGSTSSSNLPVAVSGGMGFSLVSAGNTHSCGLTTSNEAYCWGSGAAGRLGNGGSVSSPVPVAVAGSLTFSTLSAGVNVTCGITPSGVAHCWGMGGNGELGNGTITFSESPVAVEGSLTFSSLSSGSTHVCGIAALGAVYCWGNGGGGRLGDGLFTSSAVPVALAGGIEFTAISAGEAHSCGMSVTGQAYCWGAGGSGQLGDGSFATSGVPIAVAGTYAFKSISVGSVHSCGLATTGEAYCWGNGGGGRLGDGSGASNGQPVAVAGGLTFVAIDAGGAHTCAITNDERFFCWGTGTIGQLGNGALLNSLVPVEVAGFPH